MPWQTWDTPGAYTWVVPAGVTSVEFDIAGAAGASAAVPGGRGGRVQGTLTVTPGETLYLFVGAPGSGDVGGSQFGGGADGGSVTASGGARGGGGGAATEIRRGGDLQSDRRVVAGAGGGGRGSGGVGAGAGGDGGYPSGGGPVGSGGTQTADGNGGSSIAGIDSATERRSGAGGGGWFGGGIYTFLGPSDGGGGSSWTHPTDVTGVSHTNGHNEGDGWATITWEDPGSIVGPDGAGAATHIEAGAIVQLVDTTPNNLQVTVNLDQPDLSQTYFVAPSALSATTTATEAGISQKGTASPQSLSLGLLLGQATVTSSGPIMLVPSGLTVGVVLDGVSVSDATFVEPSGPSIYVGFDQAAIVQTHLLDGVDRLDVSSGLTLGRFSTGDVEPTRWDGLLWDGPFEFWLADENGWVGPLTIEDPGVP